MISADDIKKKSYTQMVPKMSYVLCMPFNWDPYWYWKQLVLLWFQTKSRLKGLQWYIWAVWESVSPCNF